MKRLLWLFVLTLGLSYSSYAQVDDVSKFLSTNLNDANKLVKAYFEPAAYGYHATAATGWNYKAGTHKFLRFDVSLQASTAFVPSNDQTFDISSLELENTRVVGNNNLTPTIAGADNQGPLLQIFDTYNGQEYVIGEYNAPKGTGYDFVPMVNLKGSIGITKSTDVMFKYFGDFGNVIEDVELDNIGYGVKQNVNALLPGGKLLPVSINALVAYSKAKYTADINSYSGALDNASNSYDNKARFDSESWVVMGVVGKDIRSLSVYGGIGLISTESTLKLLGDFEVSQLVDGVEETVIISDPIDVTYDTKQDLVLQAGLKVGLGILKLQAEYNYTQYSSMTFGIGFGFK